MQATDAINEAEQLAEGQMRAGANQVDDIAKAVHGAADELERQLPRAAELVHDAASQLQKGAGALREHNVRDLLAGLDDLGRKQPWALFGAAALAGFAISRFVKSSADDQSVRS